MKKFIFALAVLMLAGCSNKIVPSNDYAMNPIKPLSGYSITTVRWDGIAFGKTTDDYESMVRKLYPNCAGIYVDSRNPKVFYIFMQTKE